MKKVQIVGVLNITPDSFSDGGKYFQNVDAAVDRAQLMMSEGADIIDIGGESTRPGSESVSPEDEIARVVPVITAVRQQVGNDVRISIDTNKVAVAEEALKHGASIVNSLGGMSFDLDLGKVVAKYDCPFIINHIKGVPKTMQANEITYDDVIAEITLFFEEQIALGKKAGVKRSQFILDPGIGFGKTLEYNLEIIRSFHKFKQLELPLLIGVSRKSHLGNLLKVKLDLAEPPSPMDRLAASLAETGIAVQHGATYVRTHDVLETRKYLAVLEELL